MIIDQYLSESSKYNKNLIDENVYDIKDEAFAKEFICEAYLNHYISRDDLNDLNSLLDLKENSEIDNYLYEGANLDSRKYYIKFKKLIRNNITKGKKALREKKYKEAKKYFIEANDNLEECKNKIKDCDSTAGSFIFSLFTQTLPILGRQLLFSIIPSIFSSQLQNEIKSQFVNVFFSTDFSASFDPKKIITDFIKKNKALSISSAFSSLISVFLPIIIEVYRIAKNIKEKHKNGEAISIDDFNLYKNMLLQKLAEYQTIINFLIKKCEEKEKENK